MWLTGFPDYSIHWLQELLLRSVGLSEEHTVNEVLFMHSVAAASASHTAISWSFFLPQRVKIQHFFKHYCVNVVLCLICPSSSRCASCSGWLCCQCGLPQCHLHLDSPLLPGSPRHSGPCKFYLLHSWRQEWHGLSGWGYSAPPHHHGRGQLDLPMWELHCHHLCKEQTSWRWTNNNRIFYTERNKYVCSFTHCALSCTQCIINYVCRYCAVCLGYWLLYNQLTIIVSSSC